MRSRPQWPVLLITLTAFSLPATAAVFAVNATNDAVDVSPGDGVCAVSGGTCSLRAAIQEANALDGSDTILLPAATITLAIAGAGENNAATGDLDINSPMTITGVGSSTIIDAGGLDRIFDIRTAPGQVEIAFMHLRNGSVPSEDGGAIRVVEETLILSHLTIAGNFALNGGAIHSDSSNLRLEWSTVANNTAAANGGGIHIDGLDADVYLLASTISGNTAVNGGGVYACCAFLAVQPVATSTIVSIGTSTFSRNSASGTGGAAYLMSTVLVGNATITGNTAATTGGLSIAADFAAIVHSVLANANGNCSGGMIGGLPFGQYNVVSDNSCAFSGSGLSGVGNLMATDPVIGPLADNGGPTLTHALLPGSPAIDLIPLSNRVSLVTRDQRGFASPFGAGFDAGSYELSTASPTATRTTLAIEPNPATAGQPVALIASVSVPESTSGYVIFRDGETIIGAVSVGRDTLVIPSLPAGPHTITASFTGDPAHAASTSAPIVLNVHAAALAGVPALQPTALLVLALLLATTGIFIVRR